MKMRMIDVIKKSSDRDVAQIIGAVVAMRADGLSEEEALNIEYSELLRVLRSEVEVNCKPTNADRIRAMSDEELAEHFSELIKDTYENEYCKDVNDWLNWLQSEAEEVNNPDHAKRPTSMERKYAEDIYREKAMTVAIQSMEKLQEYEKLGTLEEVRKAVKKQIPKKVTNASNGDKLRFGTCPSCNKRISNVEGGNYCQNCGNAIDWR